MRVLVGGGHGFVGGHLRKLLENKGHEMITVTRKAKAPKDITWNQIKQNGLPEGIESVINLAGTPIMKLTRWTEEFKSEVLSSRVETNNILSQAVKSASVKPRSFISASAIGFYGYEDRGYECTEESEPSTNFTADLCKKWEVAADLSGTDVRKVIVRIGLVLGRDGGMMQQLYWPFFFGVGGNISDGKQWFPWVHVDDVAGIMVYAIENSDVTGVLNAVAPSSDRNSDFTLALSRSMWRFAPFPTPEFVLKGVFGDERAKMMTSSPKITPKRTLESGYRFRYTDLKSACADVVKWGQ